MDVDRLQREQLLATIAARQHGVIVIAARCDRDHGDSIRRSSKVPVHRVHAGVYAVATRV